MAFPFSKAPTLAEYIHWARETHGFRAQSIVAPDETGKSQLAIKIFTEGGPSVVFVGGQQECLSPSMIGYLDRRLGITSKWYSMDDRPLDP